MTMDRYTPGLVPLPRTTAAGALVLGRQVLTAAKGHTLEPPLAKALSRLATNVDALEAVLVQRGGREAPSPSAQPQDRRVDACWSGLRDVLAGFAKLPGEPCAAEAEAIGAALFPDGLGFLQLPFAIEWAESQVRLERLRAEGLASRMEALGLKVFLDALAREHEAYGEQLGMGEAAVTSGGATAEVRPALDALQTALRYYITKVLGSVDLDDAATQARADALLAPLNSRQAPAAKPKAPSLPDPAPTT